MTIREPHAELFDKVAQLDLQSVTGMLARHYMRRATREGWTLAANDARNAALGAVIAGMPDRKP
jgi:hypothetical protein